MAQHEQQRTHVAGRSPPVASRQRHRAGGGERSDRHAAADCAASLVVARESERATADWDLGGREEEEEGRSEVRASSGAAAVSVMNERSSDATHAWHRRLRSDSNGDR